MDRKTRVIVPNIPDGNGDVIPTGIVMPDGRYLPVECVVDISNGANLKIGVADKRYQCVVNHGPGDYRPQSIWREGDNWYVWEVVDEDVC